MDGASSVTVTISMLASALATMHAAGIWDGLHTVVPPQPMQMRHNLSLLPMTPTGADKEAWPVEF